MMFQKVQWQRLLTPGHLTKLSSIITDGRLNIQRAVCIVPGIPANKFRIILCWMHHDLYKEWSHQAFSPPPMTKDVSDKIIHE
jgi:hypothetical protein